MSRLLAANLARLKKSAVFRTEMILMLLLGVYTATVQYIDMKQSGYIVTLDAGLFICAALAPILSAALCSLYLGTEYSNGTLRNKVAVGRSRLSIYLANLITCALSCMTLCVLYFIAYLGTGLPLIGAFESGLNEIGAYVLCTLLLAAAVSALFTMAAMLIQNKAAAVAVCLLSAFLLLLSGSAIASRLSEPEVSPALSMMVDGKVKDRGIIPNPAYLKGAKRKVYEFFFDFLPGGQSVQLSSMTAARLWRLPLCSAAILAATAGCGIYAFKKKDLK